jgi:hypothetical protein
MSTNRNQKLAGKVAPVTGGEAAKAVVRRNTVLN